MNRSVAGRLLFVSLVAGLLVVGSAGAGGVASPATGVDASDPGGQQWGAVSLQSNETAEEDNETVRHRRPDNQTEDEGDLGGWLSGRLGNRLGEGAINISEGQYDFARDLVGDEFEERLDQYVEVTGNEETGERLNETRDKEEELATLLEEFEQTQAAYEAALEAGDEERARELARELVRLADEIESVSLELEDLLAEIDAELDVDLSEAIDAIEMTREDVTDDRATIIADTLVATELTAGTENATASFLDPLVVTGQLRTVEGDPVANQSIRLTITGNPVMAETDETGAFTVTYRPTDLPTGTQSVSIQYVPMGGVPYLGSEDTVTVSIEQVEPTLTVTEAPDVVAFGEDVAVRGTLNVSDVPVDDVSLQVRLGDQQVGTLPVSAGSFDGSVVVPATVPDGDRQLTVRLPGEDRALASVADSQQVTVRETNTSLSLNVAADGNGDDSATARVNGTLRTVDGRAIGGEEVTVRVGDQAVATLSTDANGAYQGRVAVPDDVADEAVSVTVVYGGDGNLAPSQQERTVNLSSASGGASPGPSPDMSDSLVVGGAVVIGFLVVLGAVGIWWIRREDGEEAAAAEADEESGGAGTHVDEPGVDDGDAAAESLLAQASDQLGAGRPERAVQDSYAAVRAHLELTLGMGGPYTHWEFYEACRAADADGRGGDDGVEDALRSLTEAFERAVYGVEGVSEETARDVLAAARELCGVDEGQSGSGQPNDD